MLPRTHKYMRTGHKITHTTTPSGTVLFQVMQSLPVPQPHIPDPPQSCSDGKASHDDWTSQRVATLLKAAGKSLSCPNGRERLPQLSLVRAPGKKALVSVHKILVRLSLEWNSRSTNSKNQGGEAPLEDFFAPLKKCVGHCLKNLGPYQKTLRPAWCPKLVTGQTLKWTQ